MSETKAQVSVEKKRDLTTTESKTIKGLTLVSNYLTSEEASELLKFVNEQKWDSESIDRRVQHYGYQYHYTSASSTPTPTIPIPEAFKTLCARLVEDGYFPILPEQVIINEYEPGQGIAAHTDHQGHFGPVIASISLLSEYPMDMTPISASLGKPETVPLPVNSLLVLKDDARSKWKHAIAKRKTDEVDGKRKKREKRISVTFRLMKKKT
jgi:alkylated DNA repair dioxygenase AlkB